jgi:methyl-accepting chemotaxis protein
LLVASIALIAGLFTVGGAALYLAKHELVSLQTKNSMNVANLIADDIKTCMLDDDMKKVDAKIKEVIELKRALSLSVFNEKGEERGNSSNSNPIVAKTIQNGQAETHKTSVNGTHIIESYLPMVNEERCQKCHDKNVRILGVLKLNSSIEDAYDATERSGYVLAICGFVAVVAGIVCLIIVLKVIVTRKINHFVAKISDLSQGDGDLTKRLDISGNDELADAANSWTIL